MSEGLKTRLDRLNFTLTILIWVVICSVVFVAGAVAFWPLMILAGLGYLFVLILWGTMSSGVKKDIAAADEEDKKN